jgi:steroid delta-isomerase-like uncharacterized protein
MGMNRYKEFLENYIDAWNRQDVDALLDHFTEDVIYIDHAIGVHLDMDSVGEFLTNFIGNYPVGFKVTPTFVCEDEAAEKFAYEWDVEGSSRSGTSMFIQGISMIDMRGDKIARNVDYWNRAESPKVKNA